MGALVENVRIPSEGNQKIDIEKIHTLVLSQSLSHIFRGNWAFGVMHKNAILAVCNGNGTKPSLRLAILCDREFLAIRNLPEQIRKRSLGFFKGDRFHN